MTSGPDDERQPAEPSFADVVNSFSLDSGRPAHRRRWGRRRGESVPLDDAATRDDAVPTGVPGSDGHDAAGRAAVRPADAGPGEGEQDAAAAVRPYSWTRGRTKSGFDLAIETLVSTSQRGRDQMAALQVEHRSVAQLCEQVRSVAEVAALMSLPLGVARVLLGDMAGLGVVTVHHTASTAGAVPDLALMERVLSGLRRL